MLENKIEWVIKIDGTVDRDEMMGNAYFDGYDGEDWIAKGVE